MQVGYVGLLKAINNFDAGIGKSLAAYAAPCITGEIKRHFRDKRWHVHVRRSAQELRLEIRKARSELAQRLSRTPTDAELAEYLGVSGTDLLDAQRAELAFQASSLSARAPTQARLRTFLAAMTRGWRRHWTWRRSGGIWASCPTGSSAC
jgi:RNA polymerase sigma-B factor